MGCKHALRHHAIVFNNFRYMTSIWVFISQILVLIGNNKLAE
jgi:hypothetical protein